MRLLGRHRPTGRRAPGPGRRPVTSYTVCKSYRSWWAILQDVCLPVQDISGRVGQEVWAAALAAHCTVTAGHPSKDSVTPSVKIKIHAVNVTPRLHSTEQRTGAPM